MRPSSARICSVTISFHPTHPHVVRLFERGLAEYLRHFNPRAPRGVRPSMPRGAAQTPLFQPAHSVWSATFLMYPPRADQTHFNPRTPCGVRSYKTRVWDKGFLISTRALRVECDPQNLFVYIASAKFQPAHSVLSATNHCCSAID